MNDEQFFLANAYLDGELTDEERRIAEADPDVMSEVELLRELQADVRDVPPPADRAREAAIGAAMAEFGVAAEPTAAGAPSPVVPYRPRPAYARYLAVAAAVVTVFGLGVVISQANLGGGDDDDAGAPVADEAPAEATFEALDEAQVAAGDGESTAEDAVADDMAEEAADTASDADDAGGDAGAEESPEEAAAEPAADDEDTADTAATESMTTVPANARVAVPPSFDPDQPIQDEEDLGVYGAYLLGLRDDGLLEPTPNTRCSGEYEILEVATLLLGATVTDVFVAVDEFAGIVFAIDERSCDVLLDASLT